MDVAVLSAFATPFMAMLAMLWHQQRTILKKLSEIGERLARIEGYLGLGIPPIEDLPDPFRPATGVRRRPGSRRNVPKLDWSDPEARSRRSPS